MTDDAAVANEGDKNKRSSKKANSSTNHFKWTEDRRFELAKVVKSKLAHKVTDTNMDIKWKMVETAIKKRDLFDDYEGDLHGLKGKFNRDQKEICDRFGFTKDSANLSGLPEFPSDLEQIRIEMAEEVLLFRLPILHLELQVLTRYSTISIKKLISI